jgi:hypothetical protein
MESFQSYVEVVTDRVYAADPLESLCRSTENLQPLWTELTRDVRILLAETAEVIREPIGFDALLEIECPIDAIEEVQEKRFLHNLFVFVDHLKRVDPAKSIEQFNHLLALVLYPRDTLRL